MEYSREFSTIFQKNRSNCCDTAALSLTRLIYGYVYWSYPYVRGPLIEFMVFNAIHKLICGYVFRSYPYVRGLLIDFCAQLESPFNIWVRLLVLPVCKGSFA